MNFLKKKTFIFSNKVYKVFKNDIKLKDFYVKDYLSIEPKNKNKQGYGGVAIIPKYRNYFYIMKVYSPILKKNFYSLPQGFIEKGEKLLFSAERELREETGIKDKKLNIYKIMDIYPFTSLINSKLGVFKANINQKILNKKKIFEIGAGTLKLISKKKLVSLLNNPAKFDMISFTCLMHYLYNLDKNDNL